MPVASESSFVGCLLGQCLGDALGYPLEGEPGTLCRQHLDEKIVRWFRDEVSPDDQSTLQYTDDSQLARELIISMIECNGLDPQNYGRRLAALFSTGRVVGPGLATAVAARRLLDGVSWRDSGEPPPSAGNGTAMRAAPIGLWYGELSSDMAYAAHEQGYCTHQDPRCSAGSVAIAGAVALAVQNRLGETAHVAASLAELMGDYSEEFAQLVRRLPDWAGEKMAIALERIQAAVSGDFPQGWHGISPFVVPSVLWSLYAALRHPQSYEQAVMTAIEVGGDVDSTGAMTGAIVGAAVGAEGLPKHLVTRLTDEGEWGYPDLCDLARRFKKAAEVAGKGAG